MRPFTYQQANSLEGAQNSGDRSPSGNVDFLAGGTTLIDLMRLDVMRPDVVLDINPLEDTSLGKIELNNEGLRLGALVRMTEAAENREVLRNFPAIGQTLSLAASAQLRNMASLGGNVLQRTRCNYFRDVSYNECNKRNPGSGCAALDGFNRSHAVLGTSEHCIATYPGDFAQALIAFDARVEIAGRSGNRSLPFARLHRLPTARPDQETNLEPGDVITAFFVPRGAWTRRSVFVKIRDRESYEFALASALVGLSLDDGKVKEARIALGGVATVPWRAREAEAVLTDQRLDDDSSRRSAEAAFANAKPQQNNAFKIALGKETLVRALLQAAAMEI